MKKWLKKKISLILFGTVCIDTEISRLTRIKVREEVGYIISDIMRDGGRPEHYRYGKTEICKKVSGMMNEHARYLTEDEMKKRLDRLDYSSEGFLDKVVKRIKDKQIP